MTFVYIGLAIASFSIVLIVFERERLMHPLELLPPVPVLVGIVLVYLFLRFVLYRLHWYDDYLVFIGFAAIAWILYQFVFALTRPDSKKREPFD